MAGSGTVLIEAWRLGRKACGFDIDPLACLIARAKSTPIDVNLLCWYNAKLLTVIAGLRESQVEGLAAGTIPEEWLAEFQQPNLPRLDYWFMPQVQAALSLLKVAMKRVDAPSAVRTLWQALFSSLIVARTSVANARDLVHSRHHFHAHTTPPDTLERFRRRLVQAERQIGDLMSRRVGSSDNPSPAVSCADSRNIPLDAESVNLVVTSPPYCNALDYTRAHKFGIVWLAEELGVELDAYVQRGRDYIGSERGIKGRKALPTGVAEADCVSERVRAVDPMRGHLVALYFADMARILAEVGRILCPGGHAVLVVCPSNIRRIPIPWHEAFASIAENAEAGYRMRAVETIQRTLDDRRRILPYMNAGQQLAGRMKMEYVLVLRKEAAP